MSKKASKQPVIESIVARVTLSKANKILVATEMAQGRHRAAGALKSALLDAQRAREVARRTAGRKPTVEE